MKDDGNVIHIYVDWGVIANKGFQKPNGLQQNTNILFCGFIDDLQTHIKLAIVALLP